VGNPDSPMVSVVVAIVSDTTGHTDTAHLEPCLSALIEQSVGVGPTNEIIVPYHPAVEGIERLRSRFPTVRFLKVTDLRSYTGQHNSREHHDELRARGMAEANGEIVALIEDHAIPAPDWIARLAEAHHDPVAAVGGAIENGIDRPLNWAVYFCDFLRYQNPLPEGESFNVSDANVAYKRKALESVRAVWQEVFGESSVNEAMRARGEKLVLAPLAVVSQHRRGLRLRGALQERYVWGRSYAATRAKLAGTRRRLFWAVFAPALPLLMLTRMTLMAWRKRRTLGAFVKALPLIAALSVSWSCGEFIGCLTGRPHSGGETAEALVRGSRGTS
jgi:Glycosyl transferase family 2